MPLSIPNLKSTDVNREVRYEAYEKFEYGRITSWNESFVFVRYHLRVFKDGGERIPRYGSTSEATRPEDLEFCV